MLNLNYLFEDSDVSFDRTADTKGLSDCTTLDFVSGESHIYGEIMWPIWNALRKRNGFKKNKTHRLLEFPAEHDLLGRRISSIREIASFIAACIGD